MIDYIINEELKEFTMEHKRFFGHLTALFTIIIWGTTFISTKILLVDFTPIEILFFRFVLGLIALVIAYPRRLKLTNGKQELLFIGAGVTGVTLYYLLENIALTYTMASNVGVIVSISPFFTAILSHFFLKGEKLKINFLIGFIVAITGICLISFPDYSDVHLNPIGEILAILASFIWSIYSILTRKISMYGYNTIQTTRRTFFYGTVFMIPALFFSDFKFDLIRFSNPTYLGNILFLGFGACALCFVSWNLAVKQLGAIQTSVYIYMVPVVTIVTSFLILHENITWITILGTCLTLTGLVISESQHFLANRKKH